VFGQASLRGKVGVWSIYRFGNPEMGEQAYKLCLMRTLKTASHETGHALSMKHCISYHCNLNGSNHIDELDRNPAWFCSTCFSKVCWNLGLSEGQTLQKLHLFWKEKGLKVQAEYYKNAYNALIIK
jgi:archaemetzincin